MYEASSLIEAQNYMNSSTKIIDSLANLGVPEHEITRLIDKQWYVWLRVFPILKQRQQIQQQLRQQRRQL